MGVPARDPGKGAGNAGSMQVNRDFAQSQHLVTRPRSHHTTARMTTTAAARAPQVSSHRGRTRPRARCLRLRAAISEGGSGWIQPQMQTYPPSAPAMRRGAGQPCRATPGSPDIVIDLGIAVRGLAPRHLEQGACPSAATEGPRLERPIRTRRVADVHDGIQRRASNG